MIELSCLTGQQSLRKVLDQLVQLQTALLLQNPDTKHIAKAKQAQHKAKPKVPV